MKPTYIYTVSVGVRNSEPPFEFIESESYESGDLDWVRRATAHVIEDLQRRMESE